MRSPLAFITGGAVRVGQAIALHMASLGYDIALHFFTHPEEATATAREIESLGRDVTTFCADQRDLEAIKETAQSVATTMGPLDLVVLNAATFYPTPFGTVTADQWTDLMTTNLRAPFFWAQALAPQIRDGGSIILIADIYGASPSARFIPYGITKAGVIAMTKGLAKALAPRIRVNAISPGVLSPASADTQSDTPLSAIPLGHAGTFADIAKAVEYLSKADYTTGDVVTVSGGKSVF